MAIYVFDPREDVYEKIKNPNNLSPGDGATGLGEDPTLELDGFYHIYSGHQQDSQFQIDTSSSFNSPVVDSNNGVSLTYTVSSGNLSTSTDYYWRGRLQDSDGYWSDWSDPTIFTTESSFVDYSTDIGTSTGGGYNAGTITYNSTEYAIIVSPKSSEGSNLEWSSDTSTSYGCTDYDDGVSNTDCMLNNDTTLSSGTATNFIDGIKTNGINGYNDWYIPAVNELQLMYDNMYNADLSGTDWDNDGESFSTLYWSSTEYDSSNAEKLYFGNGSTTYTNKGDTYYVRVVRRVTL